MARLNVSLLAALLCARAQAEEVVLPDADVAHDRVLVVGTEATLYVAVRGATDLYSSRPAAGAAIDVRLGDVEVARAVAAADGQTVVRFRVPRLPAGARELRVRAHTPWGDDSYGAAVRVVERLHLHVRADRPEYRAGQTVRWRVAALNGADAHPIGELPVDVALIDPRGTEVWHGRVTTGRTGMAAGAVPLADDLLLGTYTVRATTGSGSAEEEQVKVRAYVVPPFVVKIEGPAAPLPPGARWSGRVVAQLAYGEPVQGKAVVTVDPGDGTERRQEGRLDPSGRLEVMFVAAGEGTVHVAAVVTDGADRHGRSALEIERPGDALELAFVPEGERAAPGAPFAVTVVTTDGRGRFAPARVWVKIPGVAERVAAASPGAVRLPLAIPATAVGRLHLEVGAVTGDGRVAQAGADVDVEPAQPRALRLAEAVIAPGAAVEIGGVWATPRAPVIATLLRAGAPLATTVAAVDAEGRLRARLQPPPGAFGLATVRVTELAWDAATGRLQPAMERAPVYLLPATLDVRVAGALRHAPGTTTELAVTVRDAAGKPAAGVGLAASVVDERILALGEPRPDLPTVLRNLDMDGARAAGLAFAEMARDRTSPVAATALRAIVEALPASDGGAVLRLPAAARVAAELARLRRLEERIFEALVLDPEPLGKRGPDGWEMARPLADVLARAAVPETERSTPWRRPTEWSYAWRLVPQLTFEDLAPRLAQARLDRLEDWLWRRRATLRARLRRDPEALAGLVPAHLRLDPWGTPLRARAGAGVDVASAGPDGRFDTGDDLRREDVFGEVLTVGHGSGSGTGYGYGAGYGRSLSRSPMVMMGAAGGVKEAAVRERFDETVLWVAGVETDDAGRATLSVPLSDSITGWEVAVEAVGAAGATGAARARLETFLPLHVDADVPDELTVGDSYELPVVVANHTGGRRILAVTLAAEQGLEREGAARQEVVVEAGATAALRFPLRATAAGEGRVLVQLGGGEAAADAVRRTIRVEPPGTLVRATTTGALHDGALALNFEIAGDAAPGSAAGRLRLFRGAVDQSLDGLEGMLREPHGCFEQTSSTTYPNLLVLSLLDAGGGHADARARAFELVGKGYQRLLSYEVSGGGFSWFGEAPANQVLTAYGLLEFADMAKVYPVDDEMVARTRAWLLRRQRADGSWAPDAAWLHDWSAVQGRVSTTAFIAWTLAESGYRGAPLGRALAWLRAHRGEIAGDPYVLALWAAAGGERDALALLRARQAREPAGVVVHAGPRTLFYATGRGADVQVTALAATALARAGARADARAALAWLWSARNAAAGWGSTQGNVLALRAAALVAPPAPRVAGKVPVRLDGREVGSLDLGGEGVPTLDLGPLLTPGPHRLALAGPAGVDLDAEVRLAWRTPGAPEAAARGIEVSLAAPAAPVARGATAPFAVKLRNPGKAAVAMPTVVIPVPPGFRADRPSLQKLVSDGAVARFEDQGSQIVLYLDHLAPGAPLELPYRLEAAATCRVLQRPAQAYAYYDSDVRGASAAAIVTAF